MINQLIASTIPVVPKWFVRFFSGPYVAGETIEDALTHVKKINNSGFAATIDILGEHTMDTVSYTHLTLPTICSV